jgi:hypothetical protein
MLKKYGASYANLELQRRLFLSLSLQEYLISWFLDNCVAGIGEFGVSGCWSVRVLTRGRRWSVDEERMLEQFVKAGMPAFEIAKKLGKTIPGIHNKISNLGLEDNKGPRFALSSSLLSSSFNLSEKEADVKDSSTAKVLPVESSVAEKPSPQSSSPVLVSPDVLSSPEEALKKVAAAVVALEQPGLGRNEIQRLKCIILGAEKFLGLFERVAQYRKLEERLVELEGKYFELVKKQKTS